MTAERPDPLWPSFWADVPTEDRAPLRDILAELLGRGVLLGDTGSGRELFLLARDHYRFHLEDYLAPLGLEFIVDDDALLLQARPRTESCQLLASFTKDETLILLTLWRVWDEAQTAGANAAVLLRLDELWDKLRVYFDRIEPPEKSQIEAALTRLKRHRLVRTQKPDHMEHAGDILIEVLPSLARAIPFDSIERWQERVDMASPQGDAQPDPLPLESQPLA